MESGLAIYVREVFWGASRGRGGVKGKLLPKKGRKERGNKLIKREIF